MAFLPLSVWLKRKPDGRKPRKRIPRVSDKRRLQSVIYRKRRKEFLVEHRLCQTGLCKQTRSVDVHHRAGRSGSNYLNRKTWVAVCRSCHVWIHSNPSVARELGLLVPH